MLSSRSTLPAQKHYLQGSLNATLLDGSERPGTFVNEEAINRGLAQHQADWLERVDGCTTGQFADVQAALPAGKTTLINHILSQPHGRKVAVIENEFGEVGIDNDLIVGKEDLQGDELTILENGCLCCTVRDDLVKALNGLVQRGGFDQVLIETTGALLHRQLTATAAVLACAGVQRAYVLSPLAVHTHGDE